MTLNGRSYQRSNPHIPQLHRFPYQFLHGLDEVFLTARRGHQSVYLVSIQCSELHDDLIAGHAAQLYPQDRANHTKQLLSLIHI